MKQYCLLQDYWCKNAFVDLESTLSFNEWMFFSYQLSQLLVEKFHIQLNNTIVVSIDHSIDLPWILLGISLSGATNVLVDSEAPDAELVDRIQFTNSVLCIIEENRALAFPIKNLSVRECRKKIVCRDSTRGLSADMIYDLVMDCFRRQQHTLYILFTSGTTAAPKGVCVGTCNFQAILSAVISILQIKVTDSLLALTSITFDIAQIDFWTPLFTGATTHLISNKYRKNPQWISQYILNNRLSLIQATPTIWQEIIYFLEEESPIKIHPLKFISAGEVLSQKLAKKMLSFGETYNAYGPTETTIYATIKKIEAKDLFHPLSIGQALPGVKIKIVDENFEPVPHQMHGECLIGGVGVTSGYFKNEVMTKQSFIKLKGDNLQEMYYRSGDIVSLSNCKDLNYHGRVDHQVKINGVRLNLNNIDQVLVRNFEILESLAVYLEDEQLILVFYTESKKNRFRFCEQEVANYLYDFLKAQFPLRFLKKNKMPRNESGKISKKKLLEEYIYKKNLNENVTEFDKSILEKLDIESCNLQKNFFENGINSARLIRLQYEIDKNFNIQIPLYKFMAYKNMKDLLAEINTIKQSGETLVESEEISAFEKLREKRSRMHHKKRMTIKDPKDVR